MIVMAPDDFVGIPYANKGDSFDGCDCWGLVWLYHRLILGREIPRYGDYADAEGADIPQRIREGWTQWAEIDRDHVQHGDVLVMRIGQHPVHVGIALDSNRMLHVLEGRNACVENFRMGMWKHALVRVGRWMS